jgi:hypothetical protein
MNRVTTAAMWQNSLTTYATYSWLTNSKNVCLLDIRDGKLG